MLGVSLGVNNAKIDQIKQDHRFSTVEQIYYMLVEWKRNTGEAATLANLFKELGKALATVNWDHIEQKMGFQSKKIMIHVHYDLHYDLQ